MVLEEDLTMKFYIVDCFAKQKYEGNQLLVVEADRYLTDEEQQRIAKEINFQKQHLFYRIKR